MNGILFPLQDKWEPFLILVRCQMEVYKK